MKRAPAGFTAFELILTIALFGVVLGTVSIGLSGLQNRNALQGAAAQVVDDLRRAETQALSGYDGDRWGLHLSESTGCALPAAKYYIYRGATFTTATDTIDVFTLPGNVKITALSLGGGCDLSFSRFHGITASPGTVTLTDPSGATSTVSINGYGRVVSQ